MCDLCIAEISHYSASVEGGLKMMLFCEKISKEDIQIRFFEEQNNQIVWEDYGQFQPHHVHKQVLKMFQVYIYKCNLCWVYLMLEIFSQSICEFPFLKIKLEFDFYSLKSWLFKRKILLNELAYFKFF